MIKVKALGKNWNLELMDDGWYIFNQTNTEGQRVANRRVVKNDAMTYAKQWLSGHARHRKWT